MRHFILIAVSAFVGNWILKIVRPIAEDYMHHNGYSQSQINTVWSLSLITLAIIGILYLVATNEEA